MYITISFRDATVICALVCIFTCLCIFLKNISHLMQAVTAWEGIVAQIRKDYQALADEVQALKAAARSDEKQGLSGLVEK